MVDALARLGTREITLIGGEAYLRKDWTEIIRRICSHDIYVATQTGGRNFTPQRLAEAVDAGLGGLGVSLDGLHRCTISCVASPDRSIRPSILCGGPAKPA